jgi:hypothetical protein
MIEAGLLTSRSHVPFRARMDCVAGLGLSGVYAIYLLLGATSDANAQRHDDTLSAAYGAAGKQPVTGTDASMATGGAPPADQRPREVPIGMTPEGLADTLSGIPHSGVGRLRRHASH